MLKNDGDIIKGLGFVTLYSAYMEEMIDDFLSLLNGKFESEKSEQRWPVSRKIKKAISILKLGSLGEQKALFFILEKSLLLFDRRNQVVHGRIYAKYRNKDVLKSGRPHIPDRPIDPGELYDLANDFDTLRGDIYLQAFQIESRTTRR